MGGADSASRYSEKANRLPSSALLEGKDVLGLPRSDIVIWTRVSKINCQSIGMIVGFMHGQMDYQPTICHVPARVRDLRTQLHTTSYLPCLNSNTFENSNQ